MAERTHYEILGIAPDASAAEVKSAYRRLARTAHPDAGGNAALFSIIEEAHRVLSDPRERDRYDAQLRGAAPPRSDADRASRSTSSNSRSSEHDFVSGFTYRPGGGTTGAPRTGPVGPEVVELETSHVPRSVRVTAAAFVAGAVAVLAVLWWSGVAPSVLRLNQGDALVFGMTYSGVPSAAVGSLVQALFAAAAVAGGLAGVWWRWHGPDGPTRRHAAVTATAVAVWLAVAPVLLGSLWGVAVSVFAVLAYRTVVTRSLGGPVAQGLMGLSALCALQWWPAAATLAAALGLLAYRRATASVDSARPHFLVTVVRWVLGIKAKSAPESDKRTATRRRSS